MTEHDGDGAGPAPAQWGPPAGPGVPPMQAPGGPVPTRPAPGAPTTTYLPPGAPTAPYRGGGPAVPLYSAPPGAAGAVGQAMPYPPTTAIGATASPPPVAFPPAMPYGAPMPAHAPTAPTSSLAITGMVLSLIGFATCGVTSIVGLILSIVGLRQIKASRGALTGEGLAIAGIVVGAVFTLLFGFFWLS